MKLSELLKNKEVYCATVGQTVQQVAQLMTEKGIGAVPVLDDDKLMGIFTERDLLQRIIAVSKRPENVKVEEVMTRELIIAPPDYDVKACIGLMKKYNVRHIPIVNQDELVGIISLRDLLDVEIEDKKFEIRVLKEYIHYIPPFAVNE